MKIAYIVRHYNKRGGISRYVAELAEWFAKDNEVHVFTADWDDINPAVKTIQFHKVPITSFKFLTKRKKFALNLLFEVSSFNRNSRNMVKKDGYDIIHTQGDYSGHCDVYTAGSCHRAWLKLARAQSKGFIDRMKKSTFNPLHRIILGPEDHSIKTCLRLISVSKGVKEEILANYKVPGIKIVALPNGVDTKMFNPAKKALFGTDIRKKYGFSDDDLVMIFPAHQFERKGLGNILKAMSKIGDKKIRLLVVGRDSSSAYDTMAKELGVDKQITFAGETQFIERLYAASDLMVFPTVYEPFGMVITEAMASGLPVIVSKTAGAAELMTNWEDGILLKDHSNVNEIANAILYCKNFPSSMAKMGKKARQTAEKYTWNYVAEKTNIIYKQVFKEKYL